jgi:RNA polymerase sigma-70 factor (ECF subfamily)
MDDLRGTIRRVLGGDREAYTGIVREHQDMLLAFAAFRIPDAALVDEVVQQTFIRAYEQLADFDPAKDFGTWLRAICRFMILAELKRRTRDRRNRETYRDRVRDSLLETALPLVEEGADADELQRLRRCLQELQETSRKLVHFRYQQGLPLEDIARQVGQSASWVATTLFRVRDALRRCITEAGA